jgi:hypothetical protein
MHIHTHMHACPQAESERTFTSTLEQTAPNQDPSSNHSTSQDSGQIHSGQICNGQMIELQLALRGELQRFEHKIDQAMLANAARLDAFETKINAKIDRLIDIVANLAPNAK